MRYLAVLAFVGCSKGDAATPPPKPPDVPQAAATSKPAPKCVPVAMEKPELMMVGDDAEVPAIAFGDQLETFHKKLDAIARGTATDHLRIAFYGDSNGTRDFTSGDIRRIFQARYTDAGHGFIAMGRPWNWYLHRDVRHDLWKDSWDSFTVTTKPVLDLYDKNVTGYYGHAMIVAESKGPGGVTWVATDDKAPVGGRKVSRFEVFYLKKPFGGKFDVKIDGQIKASVDTDAKDVEVGFQEINVDDGPHKMEVVPTTGRKIRILGATMERMEKPSVIVDALGVGSLNCLTMLRDHPLSNAATLKRRNYDLVIFHIGSNTFVVGEVATCMKQVIERHRAALPNASFLIMTPPDFLDQHHPPKTASWFIKVVAEQRRIAEENKAAYFDFFAAMGGDGSMGKFHEKDMDAGDFVHLNAKGGTYMAGRVVSALVSDFQRWQARTCTE
jgi:hypothetical protein